MANYSYAQLEALWIDAGGPPNMAGLMASIALAESSGNPDSNNYTDNNGTQTSWGLWQISNGTHNMPVANMNNPMVNAQQAVLKYRTQGLSAWGTYDTGAYKQYYQGNTTPDTSVSTGAGLSDIATALTPYAATQNVTAKIDDKTLAQQYGYAYAMLQSIPDLKNIFTQAVAQQWSATQFQAALMNTNWYKEHSAAQRAYIAEGYADPATQQAQWQAQIASIEATAAKMGASTEPGIYGQIATLSLMNGWNADQIQQFLSKYIQFDANGAMGGQAGQEEMSLRALAQENGVKLSNDWLLTMARHIANDTTTLEDAGGYIRKQAEQLFPEYASQIQAGQNMSDLAAPYIQDYQKILEVGPNQTTLFDPTLVKALQYKDPTGKTNALPLWQFDQQLRNDPRWVKTQNAQDSIMGTARSVLQDFGFSI